MQKKQNEKHGEKTFATEKVCPVCGKAFLLTGRCQKYCGRSCRLKAYYREKKQQEINRQEAENAATVAEWKARQEQNQGKHKNFCVWCFKQFYSNSPHQLYCSETCRRLYGGKSMTWRSTQK